jgi:hypothetical protein
MTWTARNSDARRRKMRRRRGRRDEKALPVERECLQDGRKQA